mgnify:CR=1 FL=1
MAKYIFPDYTRSIVNMMASIRRHFGLEITHNTLKELDEELNKNYKNIIIVLLDGMGSKIIENSIGNDNFFTKHKKCDYMSIFPPTTVAATTALLSTKTPIENGWLGWHEYIKEIDCDITMFRSTGYYDESIKFDYNVANKYMPYLSIVDELKTVGITSGDVYPAFREGGAKDFDEFLAQIKAFINKDDSRKFAYCYWEQPDHDLHDFGCTSEEVKKQITTLNDKMEEFFNKEIDDDTLIIVTADHGHIDIVDTNLAGYPNVLKYLKRLPSIEPRAATFFVKEGMEEAAHFCSLCTSCGRCNEVCPVNISLKDLFLENRKDLVKENKSLISERNFLSFLFKKMNSRKNLDKYGSAFKDIELSFQVKKKWGSKRELPKFAKESFSQYWKNINKLN